MRVIGKIKLTILLALYILSAEAQTTGRSVLQDQINQFEHEADSTINAFEQFSDSTKNAYIEYIEQVQQEYSAYRSEIEKSWGDGEYYAEDTKTQWVEYSDDFQSRSIVDFENGKVELEVIVPENSDSETNNRLLLEALTKMLNSRGTSCPYSSKVETSKPLTQQPILYSIFDFSEYNLGNKSIYLTQDLNLKNPRREPAKPVVKGQDLAVRRTPGNLSSQPNPKTLAEKRIEEQKQQEESKKAQELTINQEVVEEIIKEVKQETYTIEGKDEKQHKVIKIEMSLLSDRLSKMVALYSDIVSKYSNKFDIEPALIFAVIEQESNFNPEAVSYVGACGLMQLMPKSGGADAYRFVYNVNTYPTRSYLFDPDHNIELGTAYLRILFNQFSRVNNNDCRRLCVIASYNTGAGNVSRSFIGSTALGNAFDEINAFNYQSLYGHLTNRLSTEEARNYVKGVSKRREKYLSH